MDRVAYLYVANAGSDTVSAYTIDANTGALTPLSPATIATGKGPASIAVDSNLGYVFVANNGGSNDISAFSVDDGRRLTPVPGSPFPAGGNPLSLAFGAGGKFLYTANPDATNPSISGFSIDPTTGALSPLSGSPFPLPVSHYMATGSNGRPTCMSRRAQASSAMPSMRPPARLLRCRDSRLPPARMPIR